MKCAVNVASYHKLMLLGQELDGLEKKFLHFL